MTIEIKVPILPESVTDATVAKWYKQPGDAVTRDESLVDLETDKVMLEVSAPASGVISKVLIEEGKIVTADTVLAVLLEGEKPAVVEGPSETGAKKEEALSPAVRRLVAETGVDISHVQGTGKGGRLTKQDVQNYIQSQKEVATPPQTETLAPSASAVGEGARVEKRVPMSRLRARIAERLVEVQHSAAILTTFNEVNMQPVMELRKKYKDQFEKTHGVRLGFMSFFTKASIEALKRFPAVNASIDGQDVIYHNYCDVGIAISGPRGLVVPILRNAEMLGMADIEKSIKDYAEKAKTSKLTLEDMTGGTFTITNGGIFGSMLSTPIINPPQSAILGMHNIVERAVVENGEVVVRPMMYLALSYDHRIIDGRESVSFLLTIKEMLEDPSRLLLEV